MNKKGFYIDDDNSIVDFKGYVKFDADQQTKNNDIPRLFNYSGRRYDIKNVIGDFDKNMEGEIIIEKKDGIKGQPSI